METYTFELTGIKDYILDKGETFEQTIDDEDLEMENNTIVEAVEYFTMSATQKVCYISKITVKDDGKFTHDIVENTIQHHLRKNNGDVQETSWACLLYTSDAADE